MSNEVAVAAPSAIMDPAKFEHMCRVGKMLALSPLFPQHLKGSNSDTAIANGVLCMNMAYRLNEDVLTVAQNIYFVSGKPGWSASYMIGKANQSGVFKGTIDWEVKGEGADLDVTAFATIAATGARVTANVSFAMAKADGWTNNKKYQTMPLQMLKYRSATWLIRLYCPEVMIGVPHTADEIEDGAENAMRDITPAEPKPAAKPAAKDAPKAAEKKPEPKSDDAEVVEAKAAEKNEPKSKDAAPKSDAAQEIEDEYAGLMDILMNEIRDSNPEDVSDVMEGYTIEIREISNYSEDLHQKISDAIKARKAGEDVEWPVVA